MASDHPPLHDSSHVLDEHAHLREILATVRETLTARLAAPRIVAQTLSELAEVVQEHFQHEEQGGYFAEAIDIAPRLSKRADRLLGQHPTMAVQLEQLAELASHGDASAGWWQLLNSQFDCFLHLFEEHEAAENTLIQEAYNEDIGAED